MAAHSAVDNRVGSYFDPSDALQSWTPPPPFNTVAGIWLLLTGLLLCDRLHV